MKLISAIIKTELEQTFDCKLTGSGDALHEYDAIEFWQDSAPLTEPIIYVANHYPAPPKSNVCNALILITDPNAAKPSGVLPYDYFVMSKKADPITVLNETSRVFSKYNRWDEALRDILRDTSSIDELVRVSVPIFQNAIAVINSVFDIVSLHGLLPDTTVEKQGFKVAEHFMERTREEFPETKKRTGVHLRDSKDGVVNPVYTINLYDGSFYLGVVCIVREANPLREMDAYLLEHFANSIRKAFLVHNDEKSSSNRLGMMLSSLMEGGSFPRDTIAEAFDYAGIQPEDEFRCIAILNGRHQTEEYNAYCVDLLGEELPLVLVQGSRNATYAVLDESWAKRKHKSPMSLLKDRLEDCGLRAGISEPFFDIAMLQFYAEQSYQAAIILQTRKREQTILRFEDCWLNYLVHATTGSDRPLVMTPPGLARLYAHDAETDRVSYVETLKAYLFNNMNSKKAAESLYISRNSFISRMERVEEILDMDLEDPKIRFRLMYSIFSTELN